MWEEIRILLLPPSPPLSSHFFPGSNFCMAIKNALKVQKKLTETFALQASTVKKLNLRVYQFFER